MLRYTHDHECSMKNAIVFDSPQWAWNVIWPVIPVCPETMTQLTLTGIRRDDAIEYDDVRNTSETKKMDREKKKRMAKEEKVTGTKNCHVCKRWITTINGSLIQHDCASYGP